MKTHTIIGAKILSNAKSNILKCGHQIALAHHERFNGTGYPNSLSGHNIPLAARIVALIDVFDAIISGRPYKPAYPIEQALDEIKKERETHFDPEIADVFLASIEEILRIKEELRSEQSMSLLRFIWGERD